MTAINRSFKRSHSPPLDSCWCAHTEEDNLKCSDIVILAEFVIGLVGQNNEGVNDNSQYEGTQERGNENVTEGRSVLLTVEQPGQFRPDEVPAQNLGLQHALDRIPINPLLLLPPRSFGSRSLIMGVALFNRVPVAMGRN